MENNISLSVVMTYKSDGSYKDKHLLYSIKRWEWLFPEVEIIVVEDYNQDGQGWRTFNKSKLLNQGAERATRKVLFFCDIDMIFSKSVILSAYKRTLSSSIVLPLNRIVLLNEKISERIMLIPMREEISEYPYRKENSKFHQKTSYDPSGCYMITKENYYLAGGHDERFIGWGDEDSAFIDAAMTIIPAPFSRIQSDMLHLYHPRGGTTLTKEELHRRREFYRIEYKDNRWNKEKMLETIANRYKNNE